MYRWQGKQVDLSKRVRFHIIYLRRLIEWIVVYLTAYWSSIVVSIIVVVPVVVVVIIVSVIVVVAIIIIVPVIVVVAIIIIVCRVIIAIVVELTTSPSDGLPVHIH